MMDRKDELLEIIENDTRYTPIIDEIIFLEDQIRTLKGLPFIQVSKKDPSIQRTTPAARLYREFLQQYTNLIRILMKATYSDDAEETSPLREWMNERIKG